MLKNNKTDLKLIAELQKDGGVSYSDLGNRLGIIPRTVAKRVEGLIESKLMTIRAQPNPYKLNLSASAVIAIKANPTKIDHVCELLSGHFHVNLVQTVFSRMDIMIIVYFSRWDSLHHFIMTLNNRSGMIVCVHTKNTGMLYEFLKKKISPLKGLINAETFIRAMVKKTYYGWLMETNEKQEVGIQSIPES